MKALVYNGPRDVTVTDVDDPRIERPTDVLIRITRTNICGSDLHMYEGRTDMEAGRVLGHENLGEVVEIGSVEDWDASALAAHSVTAHLFLPNVPVKTPDSERPVVVDLYAADALFAIQIDDWYHALDRQSYRRERERDRWLQRAGIFVTRFLAEDIENRLERVVEEIALGVATRRAADPLAEKSS